MGSISFTAWQFAAAGAVCAAAPLVIHLLNRRRYRVVHWAAMDFLRQAQKQSRRIWRLRDLLLLVVRTLAILLLGLALARPYFTTRGEPLDPRQPVHAILVLDNSLSMAYETLEGTLLDKAKAAGREIIEQLPAGSRISILPACGSRERGAADASETNDAALERLERIKIVDRSATVSSMLSEVERAAEAIPELGKSVFLIGDQQELNWRDVQPEMLKDASVQVVAVGPNNAENAWVSDLRIQDGLADMETPATVIVELRYQGAAARRDVQVTLAIEDRVVGQQIVALAPGETREVDFQCSFDRLSELPQSTAPVFVSLRASITPDRLPADDERYLAVPVVAALPVVFIDQYGPEEEDAARGRLGETRHLRRLLAPRTSRSDAPRQLVQVRHTTPDRLKGTMLSDARLVVVAGLREPGGIVGPLREYVERGGQLLLAAGGDFDPAAWNSAAWNDGKGILPRPLTDEPIGQQPEAAGERVQPFSLSLEGLADDNYFQFAGVAPSEWKELFSEPFFFKAVAFKEQSADDAVDQPRIHGRYDLPGGPPFLVSRRIGRGTVLFCTTGLLSSWNTLPKTNAMLIFDRIQRELIESTLPRRNFGPLDRWALALPADEPNPLVTLTRPGKSVSQETLDVGYIGPNERGVTLTGLVDRGVYRVAGFHQSSPGSGTMSKPAWSLLFAVNGSGDESDLTSVSRERIAAITAAGDWRWVAPGESISLTGSAIGAHNAWRWLVLLILLLLAMETGVLVVSALGQRQVGDSAAAIPLAAPVLSRGGAS